LEVLVRFGARRLGFVVDGVVVGSRDGLEGAASGVVHILQRVSEAAYLLEGCLFQWAFFPVEHSKFKL